MKWIEKAVKFFTYDEKTQELKQKKLKKIIKKLTVSKEKLHKKCEIALTKKERAHYKQEFKALVSLLKKAKKRLQHLENLH
ncbi:MAG: hypothetical protein U9R50_08400 [Campylobacterota bacterium]|nr:hypothetical protein [Campylobacterota bacterium]